VIAFKSCGRDVVIHEPVVILQPDKIDVGDEVRIDAFADLRGGLGLTIGPWTHIANHASINIGGGVVELGAESAVAAGGRVLGGSADPDWPSMSAAARFARHSEKRLLTSIGPRAVVCVNAVVLPGCHLGEGAILAAGSVATRPIPPWEIWAGAPARFIKARPHR
jgi:acetyltransferase-like isoleucine patch superfamily enzyme